VLVVLPEMVTHLADEVGLAFRAVLPITEQRYQVYLYVGDVPVQVPLVALRVTPTLGVVVETVAAVFVE